MHARWCVQAAQCNVCVARVSGVAHAGVRYGASVVVHSDSAVGHVGGAVHACRWWIACRHMAGAVHVVRSYIDAVRVVRANIGAVRADIGAVRTDIGAVRCGYRFTGA